MIRCLNCMQEFDEQYGVCPNCGHIPGEDPKEPFQLRPGVVLAGRYVVGTALGVGGFGITYRAWDNTLQKMLAIKEYYPSANGIVNRVPGKPQVIVYSGNRAVEFENGKVRFLAEARNMARFNTHPNIVHVYDFFEENGTAYIVMEFLDGISYKQFIAANGGKVDQKVALEVTLSVLDALKEIHKAGIIHRDISPDNVFICMSGIIKLIDFGAARFSTGEEEKTLSIILKPGYAPPEQYRSRSKQGPWTDIYAVGAMFYRALTGVMPDESVNRMVQDRVVPPHELNPEIPENLSNAIMRAMALNQELRFRNVDQFREAIQGQAPVRDVKEELKRRKLFRAGIVAGVFTVIIAAGAVCLLLFRSRSADAALDDAKILVWYPVSGEETEEGEEEFLSMAQAYQEYYPNIEIQVEAIPADEYGERLAEALETGENVPTVFESTSLDSSWNEKLAAVDEAYEWLTEREEMGNYYFLEEYRGAAENMLRMPMSFEVPVVYGDTLMAEDEDGSFLGAEELADALESGNGYAVDPDAADLYGELLPDLDESQGYEAFVVDLEAENVGSGEEFDADQERAAALEGKVEYYLSDTSEYERVQADMAGVYQVILLKDMPLTGRLTNLWSVSADASPAEQKAGVRLLYFLMSKENQQIMNIQNGRGLPLHREIFDEYETMNAEFAGIGESLEQITMKAR